MAEPLSIDLRKRVVAAIKGGMSRRGAAAHFQVGVSSAIRWAAQVEKSGARRHADGATSRSCRERASLQRLDDLAVLRPAEDHAQKSQRTRPNRKGRIS